ncbi:MAG: T9SS type A sorting domain-containing protein [Flavobacteriales bacterium]|nr:T9SS type A sorting domain-containing protein [Flavobacteriales bacterium]
MRYLFLLLSSILSFYTFAQAFEITGITQQNNQITDYYCDSTVAMSFSALTAPSAIGGAEILQIIEGTNFTGFQFTVSINWGDGTTTTHSGGTSTAGTLITMAPAVNHYYLSPGTYQIITTVYNPQNQTTANNLSTIVIGGCSIQLYSFVGLDCDGDGVAEQNITTPVPATIMQMWSGSPQNITLYNGMNTVTGMPSGNLMVTIDQDWLSQNGYTVSPNTFSQFYSQGYGAYTISIVLNCINTTPCSTSIIQSLLPNNLAAYSTTTQSSISSFSWLVTPYDNNGAEMGSGQFSTQANVYLPNTLGVEYVIVCLDATFNDGCIFSLCDTIQVASGVLCTSGYVFCDANNNYTYDSGEFVLSNVPLTISNYNTSAITTVTTNTNGYYSADILGSFGDSVVVSINPNYLASMGYTVALNSVMDFPQDCQTGSGPTLINFPVQCANFNPFPYLCYSGYIYCDANGNGIQNVGEAPLMGAPITLSNTTLGGNTITVYSDSSGFFSYCGSIYGVTSVAVASVSQSWLTDNGSTLPNNNNIFTILGSTSNITQPLSIGVYCAGSVTPCSDLWTTVTPWIGYFQGQNATIRLNWGNYGPGSTPYTLTLTWPANVTLNTWSILNPNYVINGNSITWTINSTQTSFSTTDHLSFTLPSGLINGEEHIFTSSIFSTEGTDCYEGNNTGGLLQILGNAYDPNDKNVYRKSYHDYGISGFNASTIIYGEDDLLEYTIRFQNTGTAPAQNVYIIDTLDTELDWSTFQLLNTTHEMNVVNLGNGVLRFEFNNIWLPDSSVSQELSQGHLIFRIRETPGNEIYSEITNTAYIFFDWNPAIITNTTYNMNDWIEFVGEENAFRVEAFPNPMQNELTLKVEGKFNYEIHDLTGRKLSEGMGVNQTTINTESLATGTYLLSVYVNGAKQTGKVLKY